MAPVAVTLLGGFEIRADGAARDLPGQKDRALLAVLALTPGAAHTRDKLAGLLWSDRGDVHARDSLKHALARLHSALGRDGDPLVADRQSVRLDPAALTVDVAAFERLLAEAPPTQRRRRSRSTVATCSTASASAIPPSRNGCASSASGCAAGRRRPRPASWRGRSPRAARDRAAAAARRLLELDPLREDACRALMRIHADRGEAARALRLYDALRDRLQREFGVRPERETTRLCEAIRQGGEPEDPASPRGPVCPTRLRPCPTGPRSPSCRSRTSAATPSRNTSPTAWSRRSSPRSRGCAGCS